MFIFVFMTVPLSKKVKTKSSEQSLKVLITRGAKQSQAAAEGEILMLSCPSGFLQSHIWGSKTWTYFLYFAWLYSKSRKNCKEANILKGHITSFKQICFLRKKWVSFPSCSDWYFQSRYGLKPIQMTHCTVDSNFIGVYWHGETCLWVK